jgi:hypothetical protein
MKTLVFALAVAAFAWLLFEGSGNVRHGWKLVTDPQYQSDQAGYDMLRGLCRGVQPKDNWACNPDYLEYVREQIGTGTHVAPWNPRPILPCENRVCE